MPSAKKRAFVLVSTDIGPMIASRLDYALIPGGVGGVGIQFMENGDYGAEELAFMRGMLDSRCKRHGPGVIAVDVGANIGAFTIPLARHMDLWGEVLAIEPQERVFYALAGNIALNNCWNARAVLGAAGRVSKMYVGPTVDYTRACNLGGVSFDAEVSKQCGHTLTYDTPVMGVAIDDFNLPRLDMIKIDVEGMEQEVVDGAARTIMRHQPLIFAEWTHSATGGRKLHLPPGLDYRIEYAGTNVVAMPREDPFWEQVTLGPPQEPEMSEEKVQVLT
jgi:FkbM family methyltransferase